MKKLLIAGALCLSTACAGNIRFTADTMVSQMTMMEPHALSGKPTPGDEYEPWFKPLAQVALKRGTSVIIIGGLFDQLGYYGLYQPEHKRIFIESDLAWNARVVVLAHEIGHMMGPTFMVDLDGEVFAMAVAHVVTVQLGIDATDLTLGWLRPEQTKAKATITAYSSQITIAADLIVKETRAARK